MKKFATASGQPPVLHRNSANLMQAMLDEVKGTLQILPELQSLIPPLLPAELDQLEANIIRDGCREALLVWQTTRSSVDGSADNTPMNILIDGHNRYAICTRNKIDFKIALREFPTLQAVRDFMIDNQLGRRNLTTEQMSYLRGLKYRNERQAVGRPVGDEREMGSADETASALRTQDRLAKEFNVSPRTLHRDRDFSQGIDRLAPELKWDVLNGKQKVSKELIQTLGRTTDEAASPLTLSDLETLKDSKEVVPAEKPAKSSKVVITIRKLTTLVNSLNPEDPSFLETCDKIIQLTQEAKRCKKA